jgi:hypothetical protein
MKYLGKARCVLLATASLLLVTQPANAYNCDYDFVDFVRSAQNTDLSGSAVMSNESFGGLSRDHVWYAQLERHGGCW